MYWKSVTLMLLSRSHEFWWQQCGTWERKSQERPCIHVSNIRVSNISLYPSQKRLCTHVSNISLYLMSSRRLLHKSIFRNAQGDTIQGRPINVALYVCVCDRVRETETETG